MIIETYKPVFDSLKIIISDVARFMGYSDFNIPDPVFEMIQHAVFETKELCHIKGGFIIYPNPVVDIGHGKLIARDVEFFIKKTIARQVVNSEQIALFTCTAGNAVSEKASFYFSSGDLVLGFMLYV